MLSKERILELLELVNSALAERSEIGEIVLVGGAVMCLVYDARAATKDVGAIFEPSASIRKIVSDIARERGLADDWLNDVVKGFIVPGFQRESVLMLSHLRVWATRTALHARHEMHKRSLGYQ